MTPDEIFENNISHFKVVKHNRNNCLALCPAHDDRKASLSIAKGRKGVLYHCFANCSLASILSAAGLSVKDTFYENDNTWKNEDAWIDYIQSRKQKAVEAFYDYVSASDGSYCFTKVRCEGKTIFYGIINKGKFSFGLGGKTRKQLKSLYVPLGLSVFKDRISKGERIIFCEGEKDTDALTSLGYCAFTCGGTSDWQPCFADMCKGADVVVFADNDPPGKKLAAQVEKDLKGKARSVKVIIPMPDVPKGDISDFLAVHTQEEFEELISKEPVVAETNVSLAFDYGENGRICQTIKNFCLAFAGDSRLNGKIRLNEFDGRIYLCGSVPWDSGNDLRVWSGNDDAEALAILQTDYGLKSRADYFDAVIIVANRNSFHPVKDMLEKCEYKGDGYIRKLLPHYLGAEDSDYQAECMSLAMLAAVSRIYQPGTKYDYCLILRGPQGVGKSTFLRLLAMSDTLFNDSLDSLDGDRAAQNLLGSWIIELAELKSLARTGGGIESVKRFISATQDVMRLPYQKRADVYKRSCIFFGSTNQADFLQDQTGNRRFVIIDCSKNRPTKDLFSDNATIDIKAAWAEALKMYHEGGRRLVLSEESAKIALKMQENALQDNGMRGIIGQYLEGVTRTCVVDIWQTALGETGRPERWKSSEIVYIVLSMEGWERLPHPVKFGKYGSQKCFQKLLPSSTNSTKNEGDFEKISIDAPFS